MDEEKKNGSTFEVHWPSTNASRVLSEAVDLGRFRVSVYTNIRNLICRTSPSRRQAATELNSHLPVLDLSLPPNISAQKHGLDNNILEDLVMSTTQNNNVLMRRKHYVNYLFFNEYTISFNFLCVERVN